MERFTDPMLVTRHREEVTTVAQLIEELTYSSAIDIHTDGQVDRQTQDLMAFLHSLNDAQKTQLDVLLEGEFERGLSEGRAREKYHEDDDTPPEYEVATSEAERCQRRFAWDKCVRKAGHEGHHWNERGKFWDD